MPSIADRLAITRTELANERTLLAYGRTALAMMAAGVGLTQLFSARGPVVAGWIAVAAGVVIFGVGVVRFRRAYRALATLQPRDP